MAVAVKYCNETLKLQAFLESPEYQAVTSKVPNFSFKYGELQNTIQQEIPPHSIEKSVFQLLFDEINNTSSQNLLQKSIEKDTVWAIVGFPDKEKGMPLLGSWTSLKKTAIKNMKKPKII